MVPTSPPPPPELGRGLSCITESLSELRQNPAPAIGAMRSSRLAAEANAESRKSAVLFIGDEKEAPRF